MQSSSDKDCYRFIFRLKGNATAEEMRQHYVEILSHVLLSVYDTVKHKVTSSGSVLLVDIFNLLIQSCPEFSHMTSYEYSTTQ